MDLGAHFHRGCLICLVFWGRSAPAPKLCHEPQWQYSVSPKKGRCLIWAMILPDVNWFSNFSHCSKEDGISKKSYKNFHHTLNMLLHFLVKCALTYGTRNTVLRVPYVRAVSCWKVKYGTLPAFNEWYTHQWSCLLVKKYLKQILWQCQ